MPRYYVCLAAIVTCCTVAAAPARDVGDGLRRFTFNHYTVHTNLSGPEATVFGRHMDKVFEQYDHRFRDFKAKDRAAMDLYLLRTREQYESFLKSLDINLPNSGGIFFARGPVRGLATWTQGKPRSATFAVLQHEGFHQFAFARIGVSLPIWANEGLAQFFEDGILVRNSMELKICNARRVEAVKAALRSAATIDFDQMLGMTPQQWQQVMAQSPQRAGLMYDQAWSMAYYMVATHTKRRKAFAGYLKMLSQGADENDAFEKIFGQSTTKFRKGWKRWAMTVQPDPLTTAVDRMEFLGQGLQLLDSKGQDIPNSLDQLRHKLKRMRFQLRVTTHSVARQYKATDEENYVFTRPNGTTGRFRLLESPDANLPPRITAQGLNPIPTLYWSRDADGQLVQDIAYK